MPQTLVHSHSTVQGTAASPGFECTLRDSGLDVAWVRVAGEFDIATAPQLEQILHQAEVGARRIVLDLRELTFMDASGVHVIVDASRRVRSAEGQLVLVRGPSHVDRLFTLTGTVDDLETVDLHPAQPPAQALVELAQTDQAA